MSSLWERTLVYLGLRDEPDDQVEWDVLAAADAEGVRVSAPAGSTVAAGGSRAVPERRVIPPAAAPAPQPTRSPNVRAIREDAGTVQAPASAPAPASRPGRVVVVHLRTFEDVEAVGANHQGGRPVLLDVAACEQPVARRIIDFVSGMTYVSGGALRRISSRGYLLLPAGVTLDAEEQERLAQAGYPLDARDGHGAR